MSLVIEILVLGYVFEDFVGAAVACYFHCFIF